MQAPRIPDKFVECQKTAEDRRDPPALARLPARQAGQCAGRGGNGRQNRQMR